MRALFVIVVCSVALARATPQTYPPQFQCEDERVDKLWAGLLQSAIQPEPAPFQVEMEPLDRSAKTDCGIQFNVHLWSENSDQTMSRFLAQAQDPTSGDPTGQFMPGADSCETVDCIHKQDTAMYSANYHLSNHVELKWETPCHEQSSVLWWFAVLDYENHLYVVHQQHQISNVFAGERTIHNTLTKRDDHCSMSSPSTNACGLPLYEYNGQCVETCPTMYRGIGDAGALNGTCEAFPANYIALLNATVYYAEISTETPVNTPVYRIRLSLNATLNPLHVSLILRQNERIQSLFEFENGVNNGITIPPEDFQELEGEKIYDTSINFLGIQALSEDENPISYPIELDIDISLSLLLDDFSPYADIVRGIGNIFLPPGSCIVAGYYSCCENGTCTGEPPNCYCDVNCQFFGDCCSDAPSDCSTSSIEPYLLITDGGNIHALSTDGGRVGNVIPASQQESRIWVLDYHFKYGLLFWSDITSREIWRAPLNGTSSGTIIVEDSGPIGSFGIAVDWIGDKLYWTDYGNRAVNVMDLSGENVAQLIEVTGSFNPTAIVVDPLNRSLFWFENSGSHSKIRRMSLDGSNPTVLVNTTDGVTGNWMAVDYLTHAIYWTDLQGQEVWSYNSNGDMLVILLFDNTDVHARGIDLLGEFLFISDSQSLPVKEIRKINRADDSIGQVIFTNFCDPDLDSPNFYGVRVVHPQIESGGTKSHALLCHEENPCATNNGGCSHLCLFGIEGLVCKCPDHLILTSNQQDCTWPQEASINTLRITPHSPMEGQEIQITCESRGNPPPTISWVKEELNESVVLDMVRIDITTTRTEFSSNQRPMTISNVTIKSTVPSDSGVYICLANNNNTPAVVINRITVTIAAKNECDIDTPDCHNGYCVDLVGSYMCECEDGYAGLHCDMNDMSSLPNNISISSDRVPQNEMPLNLSCAISGGSNTSLLQFQWYRDRFPLEGAVRPYLFLEELHQQHRGSYTCEVTARNQSLQSKPFIVSLPGIYQFLVFLMVKDNFEDESLTVIGKNIDDSGSVLYSIKNIVRNASGRVVIIVTVQSDHNDIAAISVSIQETFVSLNATFLNISRYDGCAAETTMDGEGAEYQWPETEIGKTVELPCFSTTVSGSTAYRECGGNYTQGAKWEEVDDCECRLNVDNTDSANTQQLCDISQLSVEDKAEATVNLTANHTALTATDISATVEVLESLLESASNNEEVRENFLETIDNIQLADADELMMSQGMSQAADRIRDSIATLQATVNISANETIMFTQNTFAIQVKSVQSNEYVGEVFNVDLGSIEQAMNLSNEIAVGDLKTLMEVLDNSTASISATSSLLDQRASCPVGNDRRIGYSVFRTASLFPNSDNDTLTSLIIGITVSCNMTQAPDDNATGVSVTLQSDQESACAAYDRSGRFGRWSSDSCREVRRKGNQRECVCNRITHFGLLLDLNPSDPLSPLALEVITYIGLVISLVSLVLLVTLLLPTIKWKKHRQPQQKNQYNWKVIVLNMSFSLFALYISFLIAGHVTSNKVACGIFSALLQYFFLVFFGWTTAESVYLFLTLVFVMNTKLTDHYILKAGLIVWLTPIVIVAISGGAGYEYYTSPFFCRPTEFPFWFGMVMPFVVMYIGNWILFVITMGSLCTSRVPRFKEQKGDVFKDLRKQLFIAVSLALLFGLGWGIGLLTSGLDSDNAREVTFTIQIIFAIFVGAQGLLIFLFQGVCSKDIQKYWKKKCKCFNQRGNSSQSGPTPHIDSSGKRVTMMTGASTWGRTSGAGAHSTTVTNEYQPEQFSMSEVKGEPTEIIPNPAAELETSHYAVPRPATLAPVGQNQERTTHDGRGGQSTQKDISRPGPAYENVDGSCTVKENIGAYEAIDPTPEGLPPSTKDDLKDSSLTPQHSPHPSTTHYTTPDTLPANPSKKENYVNVPLAPDQPIYEEMDATNVNAQGQGSSTPTLGDKPQRARVAPPPLPKPRPIGPKSSPHHGPKNRL